MRKKVKELKGRLSISKDGRVLAGNFGYMMVLQVSGYLFPLITIPYLARVIGVEGFGKIAFAAAVVLWFRTITDWGFNYTATRDVAQNRENKEKVAEIFSNVLWARMLLMLISLALLLLLIAAVPYLQENQKIILLSFLIVPGHIMFPDWFFQAMERMKYITIFNLLSKVLFTVMVFIFINDKDDFILQPIFISMGYFLSGMFSMYLIAIRWRIKLRFPELDAVIKTIKSSTDVFINSIVPNLYNSFSIVLLGFYSGSVSNGLLDAGRKFVEIGQQFTLVVSRVFFPFLSRRINMHGVYVRIHMGIAIVFFVILSLSAPLLIKSFYTPEFERAIPVLQIMSISLVFNSLSNIYGANFMIIKGYEKSLRNITFAVSIIGFFLAFPLIFFFDYVGAAITITISRALLGLAVMARAKNIQKKELVYPAC